MTHLPDELLNKYVLGQLSGAENKIIADAAKFSPELRARIVFARQRAGVASASPNPSVKFMSGLHRTGQPVHAETDVNITPSASVVAGSEIAGAAGVPRWNSLAMTLTVLLLGFLGGLGAAIGWTQLSPNERIDMFVERDGLIAASAGLTEALELTPDQVEHRAIGKKVTTSVRPTMTFLSHNQRYCREYEVLAKGQKFVGVACRGENKQWQVRVHVGLGSIGRNDRYRAASVGEFEIVDMVINYMTSTPPLSPEDLRKVIDNGWTTTH